MNAVWEISGEMGKNLGAGRIRIEDSGIEQMTLNLEALEVDQLTWSQREGPVPDRFQQIALWRDGVRVFSGQVTRRPFVYQRSARLAYSITASGPMWWLANTKITDDATDVTGTTRERTSIQFPPGDLAASVRRLIDRAQAAGLPIRAGVIDPMFDMPRMTFGGSTYLNALVEMLKPVADATAYLDYAAEGLPTLNVVRRSRSMPAVTLSVGIDDIDRLSLTPRDEMRASGVRVLSATRDASGGIVYSEQVIGDTTRPQIVTVSGPEIGAFAVPDNLPMVKIQTAAITAFWAEAIELDSTLKAIATDFAVPGLSPAGGVYRLYTSTGAGASFTGPTAITGQFVDQSTGMTPSGTWHRLLVGQITDFLKTDYSLEEKTLTVTQEYHAQFSGDRVAAFNAWPGLRELFEQGRLRSNTGYPANVPGSQLVTDVLVKGTYSVSGINLSYPTEQTVYAKDAYEYLEPPANFAINLFEAQNFLPWEGSVDLNPGAPYRRWIATRLNVLNGPEELRTAGAIIQGSQLDVRSGSVSLRCGAPVRLGMSAVSGKYTQASASDNIRVV